MNRKLKKAVFTDLDGTLLSPHQFLSANDRSTLEKLGNLSIERVIITGRSLFSCKKVVDDSFPIDYLVTSSGAGIFNFQTKKLIKDYHLSRCDTENAISVLEELELDFMVHEKVPNNHKFMWKRFGRHNEDFDRRLALYSGNHRLFNSINDIKTSPAQLLAIAKTKDPEALKSTLKIQLPRLNIIRTTSPLDQKSTWFEIFPSTVDKSQAAAWLCRKNDFDSDRCMAIGNDFNDIELLRWSKNSYVVSNSPQQLKDEFTVVSDNSQSGFSEAVSSWLEKQCAC